MIEVIALEGRTVFINFRYGSEAEAPDLCQAGSDLLSNGVYLEAQPDGDLLIPDVIHRSMAHAGNRRLKDH